MTTGNPSQQGGTTFRILIVDDHPIVRQGLAQLIDKEPDLEVCGGCDSAAEALREIATRCPDLVIVDISLKDSHGLDLVAKIHARDDQIKILVWSMHEDRVYAERALQEGAMGYINKQESTEAILEAIRRVLRGEIHLSAEMTSLHRHGAGRGEPPAKNSVETLSNRELEVFELIGKGFATRLIARQLDVRPKTIEAHRENIKRKLQLKNSAELNRAAVLWVLRSG